MALWKKNVFALLDLNSEINIINPTFTKELKLSIRPTDVKAWKINSTILNTYEIVVGVF